VFGKGKVVFPFSFGERLRMRACRGGARLLAWIGWAFHHNLLGEQRNVAWVYVKAAFRASYTQPIFGWVAGIFSPHCASGSGVRRALAMQ
jgi:hypothetical protein